MTFTSFAIHEARRHPLRRVRGAPGPNAARSPLQAPAADRAPNPGGRGIVLDEEDEEEEGLR